MTKYSARKTELDGYTFASKAEADRYAQLKLMERARAIRGLGVHPAYPLKVNGVVIGTYTADFVYFDGGRQVVEDVKGLVTGEASLRMRIFMALYPAHELRVVDRKGNSKPFRQRAVSERRAA